MEGHTHGGDIHMEWITTRRRHTWRGYAYGGKVHMKGHTRGGTYTWMNIYTEGNAHERAHIRRDIHTEEHTHGGDVYIVDVTWRPILFDKKLNKREWGPFAR